MNLTFFVVLWSVLAASVLALALYRKLVASNEDDFIHVAEGTEKLIPQQMAIAQKLDVVDKWGKTLTIATVGSGLVLAAVYLWQIWEESVKNG